MKVLLINGSPHEHGCTDTALREVAQTLEQAGIQTEIVQVGNQPVIGCSGCGGAEREPYVETRTFTDIVTLTRENFQTEVLDDPGLILIDFWAEWCQPCRMLAPAFEELNREEPQVKFCRVNVDEQGELAQMFGIESIPTLAVVQDRHTLTGSVGLRSKEEIKAMLDGCK